MDTRGAWTYLSFLYTNDQSLRDTPAHKESTLFDSKLLLMCDTITRIAHMLKAPCRLSVFGYAACNKLHRSWNAELGHWIISRPRYLR